MRTDMLWRNLLVADECNQVHSGCIELIDRLWILQMIAVHRQVMYACDRCFQSES